jgi:hypothetical protein
MAKINYAEALDETIKKLEDQQKQEKKLLKEQFNVAYESLKPANLIKSAIKEFTTSGELKDNMVNYAVGMGTGYLSKKAVVGSSHNPFKNILGTIVQYGVSNIVSKKSDLIKSAGNGLLNLLFHKKKDKPEQKKIDRPATEDEKFNDALYADV